MVNIQIVAAGVCTCVAAFPDGATIAAGGASVTWTGGATDAPVSESLNAPAGEIFMNQPGAGVGWTLVNGVLVAPTANVNGLRAYANSKATALRAAARTYALTGGVNVLCDATEATGTDLIGLLTWGTANPTATTNWVDDNGGVVTLTGAQCVALANAVLAYGQSVYAVLAAAMNGIANATIASPAQIDALTWPT
jgi:hypothetical protein